MDADEKLKKMLSISKAVIAAKTASLQDLEIRLADALKSASDFKTHLQQAEATAAEEKLKAERLEASLADLTKEKEAAEEYKRELSELRSLTDEKLTAYLARANSLEDTCSRLTQELALKDAELEASRESMKEGRESEAFDRDDDMTRRMAELEDTCSRLTQELALKDAELEASREGMKEGRESEAFDRDDDMTRRMAELEDTCSRLTQELALKDAELEASREGIRGREAVYEADQLKMKKIAAKLKQTMKQLTDRSAALEALTAFKESLESKERDLRATVEATQKELKDLRLEREQMKVQYTQRCSELEAEVVEAREQGEVAAARINESQTKEKTLMKKLKTLTESSNAAAKAFEEMAENLRLSQETVAELEAKDKAKAASVKKLKAEIKQLVEKLATTEESLAASLQQQEVSQAELLRQRKQLEEAEKQRMKSSAVYEKLNAAESKISELTTLNEDLQRKLNDAITDVEWALKDAEVAREEGSARKAELDNAEAEEVASLKKRVEDLQKMNREKKKELAKVKQEMVALTQAHEEEKATLEAAMESARSSVAEESSSKSRDVSKELRQKERELRAAMTKLAAAESTRDEFVQTLEQLNMDMAARDRSIEALRLSNSTLKSDLEKLREISLADKKEADARYEALNEKSKKMKVLLGKTRAVLQEKEKREQDALAAVEGNKDRRMARLTVHTVLNVPADRDNATARTWCLVREDVPHEDEKFEPYPNTVDRFFWIPEQRLAEWEAAGSLVFNTRPDALDIVWSKRKSEADKKIRALEGEKKDLQSQFEECVAAFNTYKTRAQAALKKVSGDDKSERKRVAVIEETELERATEQVVRLTQECTDLRKALRSLEVDKSALKETVQSQGSDIVKLKELMDETDRKLQAADEALKGLRVSKEEETARRLEAECQIASLLTQLDTLNSQHTSFARIADSSVMSARAGREEEDVEGVLGSPRSGGSSRLVLYDKVSTFP